MANSSQKKAEATNKMNPASAGMNTSMPSPAFDNDSKYQPTDDADLGIVSLDPSDGLRKLFLDGVRDIYWAENHLVMSLPKMAKAASLQPLKQAIMDHLEETKIHVQRLEQVFEIIGQNPQAKKCDAMEGLSKEGEGVIETTDAGTAARNLGIIMASQKVEHYEMASYKGLVNLSNSLCLADAAELLNQTLLEEQQSDEKLAQIAQSNFASAEKMDETNAG